MINVREALRLAREATAFAQNQHLRHQFNGVVANGQQADDFNVIDDYSDQESIDVNHSAPHSGPSSPVRRVSPSRKMNGKQKIE